MVSRWSRIPPLRSMAAFAENLYMTRRTFSKSVEKAKPFVNKNSTFSKQDQPNTEFARVEHNPSFQARGSMTFLSKPCSLALSPNSEFWVQEAEYKGISHFFLKLLLYYSKESRSIRNANILYKRILYQVDRSEIYDTFSLEKCFRTTFALLMLHVWLCLSRLKLEGKDGIEFGQYLYEHYNRDLELRVASAGVNLLLTTWMKDLEKIFYGNCAAYDAAMRPEAGKDELALVIWRNIFSDEDAPMPKGSDAAAVQDIHHRASSNSEDIIRLLQKTNLDDSVIHCYVMCGLLQKKNSDDSALARYTRRECACLALTDKAALFSGNLMFSSLSKSSTQRVSSQ